MFKQILCCCILGIALSTSPQAAAKGAGVFHPQTFTLDNGLQVVVISNHRAPVVMQAIVYKVGSKDEPLGKSGIAHFLEHLMFQGTPDVPAGQFAKIITRNGGSLNAFTSREQTAYYQQVSRNKLETIMKLEAGRMSGLSLLPKIIESERKVILEERRLRIDNKPGGILAEAAEAALYWHHPYGKPIIGWEHEMQTLNRQDALDFYNAWYVPNNAVLIFAGDITVAQIKPLVEKYYGAITKRPLPQRTQIKEPTHRGVSHRVTMKSPLVNHPTMHLLFSAPNYLEDPKTATAASVLSYMLAVGNNSILQKSLIEEQKIASSITLYYDKGYFGLGNYDLSTQPTPGRSIKDLEQAVQQEIQKLLKRPITKEEVEKAKARMVAGIAYAKDSAFGGASEIGRALSTGRTIEDVESWPDKIKAVTTEQVNAVLKQIFTAEASVTALLLPESKRKA